MRIAAVLAVAALTSTCLAQAPQNVYAYDWDNFKVGSGSPGTSNTKWGYFAVGPFVGNDGVASTSKTGLRVVAPGLNATTGQPAFTLTMAQEGTPENPFNFPGGFDHVKWLVYANNLAGTGVPGFDVWPDRELRFDAWMTGRSYGNDQHPFGAAVTDPDDDIRLAAAAMPTIDLETFLVADFFITNKRIYALYERLPFGRITNNYAAFTYAIPVGEREPNEWHKLSIGYSATTNVMRWLVDDVEVFRVTRPGYRLPSREHMIIDHGGVEEDVVCRQRNIGLGMFTLLDAAYPGQQPLVKLSTAPDFYFDTATGTTTPNFVDPDSQLASRLWGEGAELKVRRVRVSSQPIP